MFLSEWHEFPSALALQKKKKFDSSRLDVAEIARVPDMLPSLFPSWSGKGIISISVVNDKNIGTGGRVGFVLNDLGFDSWHRQGALLFSITPRPTLKSTTHSSNGTSRSFLEDKGAEA